MKDKFWDILEAIFLDIFKLFKNYFLHWTLSRFLIVLYSFGIILVFLIVPAIIFVTTTIGFSGGLSYIASLQEYFSTFSATARWAFPVFPALTVGSIVTAIVLGLIAFIVWGMGLAYANSILINRLYASYLQDSPLEYANNLYFSGKHIAKFIIIKLIMMGVGLSVFLIFGIFWGLFYFLSQWMAGVGAEWLSVLGILAIILGVILFAATIFFAIYIGIRLCFVDMLLATSNNPEQWAMEFFKQSWRMTKDRAGWIFAITFVAGIAISLGAGMISAILEYIPYVWVLLSYLATSYVASMIIVSIFFSVRKMDSNNAIALEEAKKTVTE